jgi:hypothetical protein
MATLCQEHLDQLDAFNKVIDDPQSDHEVLARAEEAVRTINAYRDLPQHEYDVVVEKLRAFVRRMSSTETGL